LPFIGIGISVVGTVIGMINAHHQAALANEGKVLNSTDPNALQAFVLVAQGCINGEITSVAEAQTYCHQIVQDWYSQVKSIQRGMWPYTGQKMSLDYASVWNHGPGSHDPSPDAHPPDPCNGACVIGHFFIERTAFIVQDTVKDILAGNHGTMVFPAIPPHETQSGVPEIRMIY
jgi:hypothetical protein